MVAYPERIYGSIALSLCEFHDNFCVTLKLFSLCFVLYLSPNPGDATAFIDINGNTYSTVNQKTFIMHHLSQTSQMLIQ